MRMHISPDKKAASSKQGELGAEGEIRELGGWVFSAPDSGGKLDTATLWGVFARTLTDLSKSTELGAVELAVHRSEIAKKLKAFLRAVGTPSNISRDGRPTQRGAPRKRAVSESLRLLRKNITSRKAHLALIEDECMYLSETEKGERVEQLKNSRRKRAQRERSKGAEFVARVHAATKKINAATATKRPSRRKRVMDRDYPPSLCASGPRK